MIDGTEFGGKILIVVVGLAENMLGLRLGDSENSKVCTDLLNLIIARGFDKCKKYLFLLDGAKALRTTVIRF